MDSDSTKKRRRAFTDLERRNIRARAQSHPGTQEQLIQWFKDLTGHKMSQGTCSEILSEKYNHLDDKNLKPRHLMST